MKKKFGYRIKKIISRIFNVRRWSDWDRMKVFTSFVGDGYRNVFGIKDNDTLKPKQAALTASFESAKKKFKLSDDDLLQSQRSLFRLSFFMLILAICIIIYSICHFASGAINAGFLSLIVAMIALSLAFRYNFWYYQIKNRKLGCSANEWFRKTFLGEKND